MFHVQEQIELSEIMKLSSHINIIVKRSKWVKYFMKLQNKMVRIELSHCSIGDWLKNFFSISPAPVLIGS